MTDLLYRLLYRSAYRLMRLYWAVVHPRTHGSLVAVWHGGEILLVHTSYAPYWSLPGGYVHRGETGLEAACRELHEELGLHVDPRALRPGLDVQHRWEGKRERVELFELDPAERPAIAIDRREVVAARFVAPAEALRLPLFPPIGTLVRRRLGVSAAPAAPAQPHGAREPEPPAGSSGRMK